MPEIEVGDFIKSSYAGTCCGFVTRLINIKYGKGEIPAYVISKANGELEIIPAEHAVLIAPSDDHWARLHPAC